ncbi:MAG: hypothetical protein Q4D19_11315 [Lautropia sp.]|nr:hypothetical protein [Lautropia sp.]
MNHARVLLVSAIMSALAACGGGGDGDSRANETSSVNGSASNSTAGASSSAAAASSVAVNVDGLTQSAAREAVVQANDATAAAQRQAEEAQARLAAERAQADEARQQAAEAAERAAASEAQNRAAAEQAAREAAERNEALQQRLNEAEAQAREAQEAAKRQTEQLEQAENKLAAAANRDAQQQPAAPAEKPAIPDCSQNAAAVDDPETGLKLVCESQITSGATTADVGTAKHASGRYYALPFPDKTMLFLGNRIGYKMACGEKICEWQKLDGSMDIVYAAQGKDGSYHRFTACRKGKADRLICAYPSTGKPDGVHVDDREPEAHRIGAAITDTDTSGKRGFRADAETSAPLGCDYGYTGSYSAAMGLTNIVFPWPDRSLFRQAGERWVAVFDGGNCLGDVRVETGNPDSPSGAQYWASANSWRFRVAGPDGKVMEPVVAFPLIRGYENYRMFSETHKGDPTAWYQTVLFRSVSEGAAAGNAASGR